MKTFPKFSVAALAAAAMAFPAVTSSGQTAILFDFNNGTTLDDVDGFALPAPFSATADGETVVLTVLSASAPEFVDTGEVTVDPADPADPDFVPQPIFALTGNTVAARTGIRSNALGVDNPTLPGGNEGGDINNGESFTFVFDTDVTLDNIDVASIGADGFLTITVGDLEALVVNDNDFASDEVTAFAGDTITAGTEITFAGTSVIADQSLSIRITDITVSTVVPEPASLALLGLGGLAIAGRRRKQA